MAQQKEIEAVEIREAGTRKLQIEYSLANVHDMMDPNITQRKNADLLANAKCELTVASNATISGVLPDGSTFKLGPGQECSRVKHLGGSWASVSELVGKRVLLRQDADRLRAMGNNARYVIGAPMTGGSTAGAVVLGRHGVRLCGDAIDPGMVAIERFGGGIDHRYPDGDPRRQVGATEGDDGMVRFGQLLAEGKIVDRGPSFGPRYDGQPETEATEATPKGATRKAS